MFCQIYHLYWWQVKSFRGSRVNLHCTKQPVSIIYSGRDFFFIYALFPLISFAAIVLLYFSALILAFVSIYLLNENCFVQFDITQQNYEDFFFFHLHCSLL